MKQLILFFLVGVLAISANAQDKVAVDYNNEGVAAYKAKDYKGAYESFSKAIEMYKAEGTAVTDDIVYNTGYSAYKAKKYEEAIPYLETSITAKYKASKPYIYLSLSYKKTKNVSEYEATVFAGLELYPTDKTLNKLAGNVYLTKGGEFYNAGKEIKKAANESGLNESDPDAYTTEIAKVTVEFEKALPLFEKSYDYNPKSKNTLKALQNIYTSLGETDKAAKMSAELAAL